MTSGSARHGRAIIITISLIVAACIVAYVLFGAAAPSDDGNCTANTRTAVLIVFYRPSADPHDVRAIIAATGATINDHYAHGYSLSIAAYKQTAAVQTLQRSQNFSDIQVVPNQQCIDPD